MAQFTGSSSSQQITHPHTCCECCVKPKVHSNWEPLRDVTQGEGNYGPRAFIYTPRDAFLTITEHQRLNMCEENKMARYYKLGLYRHREARTISPVLNCLRRERLRRYLCEERQDTAEEREACPNMSEVLTNIRSLLQRKHH